MTKYIVPELVWVEICRDDASGWLLQQTLQRLTFDEPMEILRTPAGELWLFRVYNWTVRVPVTKLLVMEEGVVKPLLSPEQTGGIIPRQSRPERRPRKTRLTPGMKRGVWER